jgi:hypothetical protein
MRNALRSRLVLYGVALGLVLVVAAALAWYLVGPGAR